MSDPGPPSEFGGKTNQLGIQPFPHTPEAHEQLRRLYQSSEAATAELTADIPRDEDNETFEGLLPEAEQRAIREAEGVFEKGQVWEEMEGG